MWTAPYAHTIPENRTPKVIVQTRPYRLGRTVHLLAVNPGRRAQRLAVHLPGAGDDGPVRDTLGGPPGALSKQWLTDRVQARGVKCYAIPMP